MGQMWAVCTYDTTIQKDWQVDFSRSSIFNPFDGNALLVVMEIHQPSEGCELCSIFLENTQLTRKRRRRGKATKANSFVPGPCSFLYHDIQNGYTIQHHFEPTARKRIKT